MTTRTSWLASETQVLKFSVMPSFFSLRIYVIRGSSAAST